MLKAVVDASNTKEGIRRVLVDDDELDDDEFDDDGGDGGGDGGDGDEPAA